MMKKLLILMALCLALPALAFERTPLSNTTLRTDANLVAYWPMDSIFDSVASANISTGIPLGAPFLRSSGIFYNELVLDGASVTQTPTTATFDIQNMKTVAFWARLVANPASIQIAADDAAVSSGASKFFRLNFNAGPVVSFNIMGTASHDTGVFNTDLNWHFYTWTHNGNINTSHLYYDGVEVVGTGGGVSDVIGSSGTPITFGARFDSAVPTNEEIDDVSIFSRQLSATEVLNLYNGYTPIQKNVIFGGQTTIFGGATYIK